MFPWVPIFLGIGVRGPRGLQRRVLGIGAGTLAIALLEVCLSAGAAGGAVAAAGSSSRFRPLARRRALALALLSSSSSLLTISPSSNSSSNNAANSSSRLVSLFVPFLSLHSEEPVDTNPPRGS
eukprot:1194985-Prorocentrum_minimum.AAC.4